MAGVVSITWVVGSCGARGSNVTSVPYIMRAVHCGSRDAIGPNWSELLGSKPGTGRKAFGVTEIRRLGLRRRCCPNCQ